MPQEHVLREQRPLLVVRGLHQRDPPGDARRQRRRGHHHDP